jgi:hypothetical protein
MAKASAKPAKKPVTRRAQSEAEEAVEAANMLKADHDEIAFEKRLAMISKAQATPKRSAKKRRTR